MRPKYRRGRGRTSGLLYQSKRKLVWLALRLHFANRKIPVPFRINVPSYDRLSALPKRPGDLVAERLDQIGQRGSIACLDEGLHRHAGDERHRVAEEDERRRGGDEREVALGAIRIHHALREIVEVAEERLREGEERQKMIGNKRLMSVE